VVIPLPYLSHVKAVNICKCFRADSVSLIASNGSDHFLLDTTQAVYATIQEQVEILSKYNASNKEAINKEAAKEKVSSYLITVIWKYTFVFLTLA
jgi:hypothetical protein